VSQVNLLPPEIVAGQKTRRLAGLVALAGGVLVLLLLAFYVIQVGRLGGVEDDIEAQQRTNNAIQDEIDGLVKYEDLQVRAQQQQALLDGAYRNEVSFSQALMDLSRITPTDSYVDSFGITVTGPAPEATGVAFVGTITVNGQAVGMDSVAQWITRLEEITGWVNPWVPAVNTVDVGLDFREFSVSVDLTSDALTGRGRVAAEEADAG
jgi:hypothetical protein